MRAYSYKRWSSDRQTPGDSFNRQTESAKAVCAQKGWQLDESLSPDSGISGWKGLNLSEGSMGKFKHAVESGRIKAPCVLIIDDLSRYSRLPTFECLTSLNELFKLNVTVCTANNGKTYDKTSLNDLGDLLSLSVNAHQNNMHSAELSRKVGSSWRKKKANAASKIVTRLLPAWVTIKNDKLVEIPDKANLVRRIFRSVADGVPLRTVVRQLNEEKIPPFGRGAQNKGNGWSSTHMRRLLTGRNVLGEYQPHKYLGKGRREPEGAPFPNYYPATIDLPLFHQVQSILERNAKPGGGAKQNATNLFTKIAVCACCGKSMNIKQESSKAKYQYTSLVCSGAVRGTGCEYHTINYDQIERAVLSVVWSIVIPTMKQQDTHAAKLDAARGELQHVADIIQNLTEGLLAAGGKSKTLFSTIEKLENQKSELESQIEKLESVGETNALTAWQPVDQTKENRLRLQSILRGVIKSLRINAGARTATLEVGTDPEEPLTFDLSWEQGRGSNKTKKNPAETGFNMLGKRFDYVDQLLIWKSALNVSPEFVAEHFKEDAA